VATGVPDRRDRAKTDLESFSELRRACLGASTEAAVNDRDAAGKISRQSRDGAARSQRCDGSTSGAADRRHAAEALPERVAARSSRAGCACRSNPCPSCDLRPGATCPGCAIGGCRSLARQSGIEARGASIADGMCVNRDACRSGPWAASRRQAPCADAATEGGAEGTGELFFNLVTSRIRVNACTSKCVQPIRSVGDQPAASKCAAWLDRVNPSRRVAMAGAYSGS
jgi:hypothetical protein